MVTENRDVVADIERYWRETGVPRSAVVEMRSELVQHLTEAKADGRGVSDVVGDDPGQFAESWAASFRSRRPGTASWTEVQTGAASFNRRTRREMAYYAIGIAAVIAAVAVAGQGGNEVDNEIWRWMWTIFAVVMAIGEIFTAGFFLLPFAIGAGAAAVLAWAGAGVLAQWLVFFGVSVVALAYLRRFITRQDEAAQPKVGANRWVGEIGQVLQTIDPHTDTGMVRILQEEWRASAPQKIEKGTRVVVTAVQGTRLVVEPIEQV